MKRFFLLPALLLLTDCVPAPILHPIPWDENPFDAQRARLVADGADLLRARSFRVADRSFPYDCSGYLAAILYRSGIDVYRGASELQIRGNGVRLLHQFVARYGTLFGQPPPRPGDLVFFSHTYDLNRDGKSGNDTLTHVGLVERVDEDGTITFLHKLRRKVTRDVLNLERPGVHKDGNGKVLNDHLRRRRKRDGPQIRYLAGELFAGFASVVKDRPDDESR